MTMCSAQRFKEPEYTDDIDDGSWCVFYIDAGVKKEEGEYSRLEDAQSAFEEFKLSTNNPFITEVFIVDCSNKYEDVIKCAEYLEDQQKWIGD